MSAWSVANFGLLNWLLLLLPLLQGECGARPPFFAHFLVLIKYSNLFSFNFELNLICVRPPSALTVRPPSVLIAVGARFLFLVALNFFANFRAAGFVAELKFFKFCHARNFNFVTKVVIVMRCHAHAHFSMTVSIAIRELIALELFKASLASPKSCCSTATCDLTFAHFSHGKVVRLARPCATQTQPTRVFLVQPNGS